MGKPLRCYFSMHSWETHGNGKWCKFCGMNYKKFKENWTEWEGGNDGGGD